MISILESGSLIAIIVYLIQELGGSSFKCVQVDVCLPTSLGVLQMEEEEDIIWS